MNIADILHTSSPKNMFFPQTLELGYGTSQRSENLKTWMWMAILKSWIIVKYSENRKKQQPTLLKAKRILKPKYKLSGGFRFDIKALDERRFAPLSHQLRATAVRSSRGVCSGAASFSRGSRTWL